MSAFPEHLLPGIMKEYKHAVTKFPAPYHSLHEARGLIEEEVDEQWDAIRFNEPIENVEAETRQVIVTNLRMLLLCEQIRKEQQQ